ncbi:MULTISPECIES: DUF6167 family protein [Streptomycetaceae]|uniref:Secreted protein n=1 Tax=Streptantibioticus cattleyicolor (strain ATCC 35852 / DSM 46488 / JCM 4925 / NBRC 14057 / NRRL 8057) TaxID=1003195 RepID=F8K4X1_STREN
MFRRLFWFVAGIAAGTWATTKVNRAARRLAPDSLAATAADRAVRLGGRARQFALDVRAGMTEREQELHHALGLDGTPAELPGQRPEIAHRDRAATDHAYHRHVHKQKEGH